MTFDVKGEVTWFSEVIILTGLGAFWNAFTYSKPNQEIEMELGLGGEQWGTELELNLNFREI